MTTPETLIRWIGPLGLAASWVPGYHSHRYDAIERKLAETADPVRRLGDLVKVVAARPAAARDPTPKWLVRRSGVEMLIEAVREPADGLLLAPLPKHAVVVFATIIRGAEVAYWDEDLYQGVGALLLPRPAFLPDALILEGVDPTLELAWLAGELRGELVQAQINRRAEGASVMPRLSTSDLLDLRVIIPSASERARCAPGAPPRRRAC